MCTCITSSTTDCVSLSFGETNNFPDCTVSEHNSGPAICLSNLTGKLNEWLNCASPEKVQTPKQTPRSRRRIALICCMPQLVPPLPLPPSLIYFLRRDALNGKQRGPVPIAEQLRYPGRWPRPTGSRPGLGHRIVQHDTRYRPVSSVIALAISRVGLGVADDLIYHLTVSKSAPILSCWQYELHSRFSCYNNMWRHIHHVTEVTVPQRTACQIVGDCCATSPNIYW